MNDPKAYAALVDRYGADRVADALLAKWLADPEAGESWARLAVAVGFGEDDLPERELVGDPYRTSHGHDLGQPQDVPYVVAQRLRLGTARL